MSDVLRRRNFGLLWFAGLISLTGDWMLRIALPVRVYQLTGSTLATGAMFLAGMAPALVLGSVAGVFIDRWDRRRTMIVADLLLTLAVLPLVAVRSADWLWVVYLVAFVQSSISRFFVPAEQALLPRLVEERDLPAANALTALNNNLSRLLGPPLGGAVAGLLGLDAVAVADAATFLISAVMIASITAPSRPVAADVTSSRSKSSPGVVWREWLAGLALVRREWTVTIVFVVTAITSVGEGVLSVLFVVWINQALHGGAPELGLLQGGQAVGGLVGGVVVGRLARGVPPIRLLGLSAIIFGVIDLVIFNYPALYPHLAPGLVLFVLVGLPVTGVITGLLTALQTGVPDAYRGRIFGAYSTTAALLGVAGAVLAGGLGDLVGVIPMLNVQGGGYVLAGGIALAMRRMRSAARG